MEEDGSFPFIDLIVCPLYDFAFKDDMMIKYGLNAQQYRSEGHYTPTNNIYRNMDLRTVFHQITYNIYEILKGIKIFTLDHEHKIFFEEFNEYKNETDHIIVTTKYHSNLGRCYSIHPKENIVKLGIRVVDFVAKMGIYVYFGYPGQFMNHNTKTKVRSVYIKKCM